MTSPLADTDAVSVLHVDGNERTLRLTREFLTDADPDFAVETTTDPEAVPDRLRAGDHDCVVSEYDLDGTTGFDLLERVRTVAPGLPFVLFTNQGSEAVASEAVSRGVTEYMQKELGTDQYELLAARIRTAVERHRSQRATEIQARAMDTAPVGITVADARADDEPLVYVNDRFVEMTGYSEGDALGRNCRFLQGPETDEAHTAALREAIDAGEETTVELRNYRADGTEFWNRLTVAPVVENGEVTHYVGVQEDVTGRAQGDEA